MEFALFYEIPVPRPWSRNAELDAYQAVIQQAVRADELGWHSFWTVEHHFLEEYSHCPNPEVLYGAIEVGGVIRSRDGGEHWENLSHGQYVNDDTVDMHGVLPSSSTPGTVFSVARAGMFRSTDWGDHWTRVQIEPLNAKGQTYCRCISEAPGDPQTLWVSAGPNFQSDLGVLFRSRDGGEAWERVDMGIQPKSTMFGLTLDRREPARMYCATRGGEVFGSRDQGATWNAYPLPQGATQAYALACA